MTGRFVRRGQARGPPRFGSAPRDRAALANNRWGESENFTHRKMAPRLVSNPEDSFNFFSSRLPDGSQHVTYPCFRSNLTMTGSLFCIYRMESEPGGPRRASVERASRLAVGHQIGNRPFRMPVRQERPTPNSSRVVRSLLCPGDAGSTIPPGHSGLSGQARRRTQPRPNSPAPSTARGTGSGTVAPEAFRR